MKGIDEPSDSDNTWENAESDGKKGAHRLRAFFNNLIAQDVSMGHRFGLQNVQVWQLAHVNGHQSLSQRAVSRSLKMTLPTLRAGEQQHIDKLLEINPDHCTWQLPVCIVARHICHAQYWKLSVC